MTQPDKINTKVKKVKINTDNSTKDNKDTINPAPLPCIKPLLRGRIHQMAFYKTLFLFILVIFSNLIHKTISLALIIYFASQLILYGTSYIYHTTNFQCENTRRLVQRLDHTSIYILISGTQSSVFLCYITDKTVLATFLITTWTISVLGILKVIVMRNIIEILDVMIYIGHGVCVVPFFGKLMKVVSNWEVVLFIMGGILYILGGLSFGFMWPDPWPTVFGFHEIFHVFTVVANICFLVPVMAKYIFSINK